MQWRRRKDYLFVGDVFIASGVNGFTLGARTEGGACGVPAVRGPGFPFALFSNARGDLGAPSRHRKLSAWREMQGLPSPKRCEESRLGVRVGLGAEMGVVAPLDSLRGGVAKASLFHSTSIVTSPP